MILKVYDRNLVYQGEVDDFESCILTRPYRGHGKLEMTIPMESANADILTRFSWIYAGPRRIYQILYIEADTQDQDILHIIGMAGGQAWACRVTKPPTGYSHITVTGSRDAIAKAYIYATAINPDDENRKVPHLAVAADQAGEIITDKSRLQMVRDEVERVLASDDMGYFWDYQNGRIVFDTYKGSDRTEGQSILPPAVFALKYDNLLTRRYVESELDTENVIYIGGQGEGAERTILEVGDGEGESRFEGFQDARDTNDQTELVNRAKSNLRSTVESMEASVTAFGSLTYEVDFFLGDMVTVSDQKLGKKLDTRITEVREIYEKGRPDDIEVTFGNTIPADIHMIARHRKQINQLQTV